MKTEIRYSEEEEYKGSKSVETQDASGRIVHSADYNADAQFRGKTVPKNDLS